MFGQVGPHNVAWYRNNQLNSLQNELLHIGILFEKTS
jgi:hypothetical protein